MSSSSIHLSSLKSIDINSSSSALLASENRSSSRSSSPILPIQEKNVLKDAIVEVINNKTFSESSCHKTARYTLVVAASAISCAAELSFWAISMKLDLPKPVQVLCAQGNFLIWWAIDVWAIQNIIHEIMAPKSENEQSLADDTEGAWKKGAYVAASGVFALCSQLPGAFQAYNSNEDALKMPAAFTALVGNSFIPWYSTIQSATTIVNAVATRFLLSDFEKTVKKTQEEMLEILEENQALLEKISSDEDQSQSLAAIHEWIAFDSIASVDQRYVSVMKKMLLKPQLVAVEQQPRTEPSTWRKLYNAGKNALFGVAFLSYEAMNAWYVYNNTLEITDNSRGWSAAAASVYVLSDIGLTWNFLQSSVHGLVDWVFCQGSSKKSASQEYYKMTTIALKLLAGVEAICALGSPYQVWSAFCENTEALKRWGIPVTSMMMFNVASFLFGAANATIKQVVDYLAKDKGNEKNIATIVEKYKKVGSLIREASPRHFCIFYSDLPVSVQMQMPKLDEQEVNDFIQKTSPKSLVDMKRQRSSSAEDVV